MTEQEKGGPARIRRLPGGLTLNLVTGPPPSLDLIQGDHSIRVDLADAKELIVALTEAAAALASTQAKDDSLDLRALAPELLTTEEAAQRLGVARRTVQSYIHRGLLPTIDTPIKSGSGTVRLIPAAALETFEPPPVGYPKGRPRSLDLESS